MWISGWYWSDIQMDLAIEHVRYSNSIVGLMVLYVTWLNVSYTIFLRYRKSTNRFPFQWWHERIIVYFGYLSSNLMIGTIFSSNQTMPHTCTRCRKLKNTQQKDWAWAIGPTVWPTNQQHFFYPNGVEMVKPVNLAILTTIHSLGLERINIKEKQDNLSNWFLQSWTREEGSG